MRDLIVFIGGVLAGGLIGWMFTLLVIETKHDCLPHDPKRCARSTQPPEGTSR